MKTRISLLFVAVCITLSLFVVRASAEDTTMAETRDGMLIHIKSGTDNPHSVLMGLSLALKMAEDSDVLVFFSVKGVHHATKEAENLQYGDFTNSAELIDKLIQSGAGLFACPMCLSAEKIEKDDLKDGIGVMTQEQFFGFTDGRIVTLDY